MHYLFLPLLLAALVLPLSAIASQLCDTQKRPIIASAWYQGWTAQNMTPAMIPDNLNRVIFAFAITTNDSSMVSLDPESAAVLPQVVQRARAIGASAIISIGGATGSRFFSVNIANNNKRALFVKAIASLVNKFDLDGVEIDWESPNQKGECNTFSSTGNDTNNLLGLFKDLRKKLGPKKILTAAVGLEPFIGVDGTPTKNVSDFGAVLDDISIMSYDYFGSWSDGSGSNSALFDNCSTGPDRFSANSAVSNWKSAKFPVSKIILGVPAYGHSFSVSPNGAFDSKGNIAPLARIDKAKQPLGPGESLNTSKTLDQCGQPEGISGVFNYNQLFGHFLNENGTNATGIDYTFDSCSETPFLYDKHNEVLISYDNEDSFRKKGQFIVNQTLKGFNLWALGDDKNNTLLNAVSSGMGIQKCA